MVRCEGSDTQITFVLILAALRFGSFEFDAGDVVGVYNLQLATISEERNLIAAGIHRNEIGMWNMKRSSIRHFNCELA